MKIKNLLLVYFCKLVYFFTRLFHLGSGSTWPGHIALILNPRFIQEIVKEKNLKIILVAGTNGKTTTASLLKHILTSQKYRVIQNEEGANLLNGFASSLVKNYRRLESTTNSYAIFEVDENSLPLILKEVVPQAVLILNLFRDQLDRYGEVNTIALKWKQSLEQLPETVQVVLNADDPQIKYLGKGLKAKVSHFGLTTSLMSDKQAGHDVDSIHCPNCGKRLKYSFRSYSHLGIYHCVNCDFKRGEAEDFVGLKINYPLKGNYNIYNLNGLLLLLRQVFSLSFNDVKKEVEGFKPVFGRQESFVYQGRPVTILLSKNPTGFNQSLAVFKQIAESITTNLLVVLNDRIPDGRDVSWIWDVDFEEIIDQQGWESGFTRIYVSGDRAYDMGLRLSYADLKIQVIEDLKQAIDKTMQSGKKNEPVVVLATYSAMLEVREILKGRKLL